MAEQTQLFRLSDEQFAQLREIAYDYHRTPFGEALIGIASEACSAPGICFIGFSDERTKAVADLQSRYPKTTLVHKQTAAGDLAAQLLTKGDANTTPNAQVQLLVHGTDFQFRVWQALTHIPAGETISYGELAGLLGVPKAARAVGSAVGRNPISLLVPCHRVLTSNGGIGGYHWGIERKKKILTTECGQ